MRNLLLSASLAALLLGGVPMWAHMVSPQSESGQQSPQTTKTVAGKVAAIGSGGSTFAVEVNTGTAKEMMHFVLDINAKIQGSVNVGTLVTVEYTVIEGQNLASNVTAQSPETSH